jgi:hypothetical protein
MKPVSEIHTKLVVLRLNTEIICSIGVLLGIFCMDILVNAQEFKKENSIKQPTTPKITIPRPPTSPTSSPKLSQKLTVLPIGLNLGTKNVIPSATVKGAENGKEAIDFNNWLVPFADITKALQFNVTPKDDGQLELRSVGSIITIDPKVLINDPDIGQAISIEQIRNLLKIPVEFSLAEYAIVLSPPWLNARVSNKPYQEQEAPINLVGLPQVPPPFLSLTGISLRTNLNQTQTANPNNSINSSFNANSEFKTIGSIAGGSLFSRSQQQNNNGINSWQLNELQYFRPSPYTDYLVGTQSPFWGRFDRNQSDYFGVTLIQRSGYTAANNANFSYGGITPQQRLSANELVRNITGEAPVGTLVQLVTKNGNLIVAEKLVDSSGKYNFDNVVTAKNSLKGSGNINYKLLLYPSGNLSAKPEEISLNYRNLQSQVSQGKSAFIISAGASRISGKDNFFGDLRDFNGGAAYYLGLTDEITFGAGLVYDSSVQPYGEILYQPVNSPLTLRVGALAGNKINFNADISYITNRLSLRLGGDEKSLISNIYWTLSPQLTLFSNWYSGGINNRLESGFNLNLNPIFLSLSYDANKGINGILRGNLAPFLFSIRKFNQQIASELIYNLANKRSFNSGDGAISLNYETSDSNYLASLNLVYRTPWTDRDGKSLLDLSIGYGVGSQGNGLTASASTAILPGIGLRLAYRQASLNNNSSAISLSLFTSVLLQSGVELSNDQSKLDKLRTQGGIFLQPFFDKNSNGIRDNGEDLYTEDLESLFLINNQTLRMFGVSRPKNSSEGVLFDLPPNTYRLDIDPAGCPLGWKVLQTGYAVTVASGTYTTVPIPLVPSYVVTGTAIAKDGKPMIGANVEFVSRSNPKQRFTSITNNVGIYYLENLTVDIYQVFINGNSAQPNILEINSDSKNFLELNIQP